MLTCWTSRAVCRILSSNVLAYAGACALCTISNRQSPCRRGTDCPFQLFVCSWQWRQTGPAVCRCCACHVARRLVNLESLQHWYNTCNIMLPLGHRLQVVSHMQRSISFFVYVEDLVSQFLCIACTSVEDTDAARSTKESEEAVLQDLRWLGIKWDEGVSLTGR